MTSPAIEEYYYSQAGGNPYHLLTARQKGSGLGDVIGVGARMAMPLVRAAIPYVKKA